jgi:nucleoside-diphosphate-sugar epimerase
MRYLVTGCAGFIGSSITDRLLAAGHEVVGIDCFTDYYDTARKRDNLSGAVTSDAFRLLELDLSRDDLAPALAGVDGVFHQAAQAGVRASWGEEFARYTDWNVLGTQRLLEAVVAAGADRAAGPARVVYASSSIYGEAEGRPTREDALPAPISPYGVTKLAAEHLMLTYSRNFAVPTASLRYFTVFGERQRPDMAFHRFIRAILTGQPITLYGDGEQSRDFTYVGDIVDANLAAMGSDIPHGVWNICGGSIITVREVLDLLGEITGREVLVDRQPPQKGDVRHTSADTTRARADLGYDPQVSVAEGLAREAAWLERILGSAVTAT